MLLVPENKAVPVASKVTAPKATGKLASDFLTFFSALESLSPWDLNRYLGMLNQSQHLHASKPKPGSFPFLFVPHVEAFSFEK